MDSTILIIFIVVLLFGNVYQATRPPKIQIVEVPVAKPKKRRRRKKVDDDDEPVDLDVELNRIIRAIERKSGLVTSLRTIYLVADMRRVEVWDDPLTGKFGFNFQDVLEYQRALEAANRFEQELQSSSTVLIPEETQQ